MTDPEGPPEDGPQTSAKDASAGGPADDPDLLEDAAETALRRARAVAESKGLRPGRRPPPRRRGRSTKGEGVGAGSAGRDPQLLGDQMDRLVSGRGWGSEVAAGQVMGRWEEIVGSDVAAHAQPVTFEAGVLVVRAESTAWATQIRMLSSTILAAIERSVGPDQVQELKVHGPSAPSWRRGPRRTHGGRGPRDTYG